MDTSSNTNAALVHLFLSRLLAPGPTESRMNVVVVFYSRHLLSTRLAPITTTTSLPRDTRLPQQRQLLAPHPLLHLGLDHADNHIRQRHHRL